MSDRQDVRVSRAILSAGDADTGRYLPPDPDDPLRVPHKECRVHLRHRLAEGLYA